MTDTNKKEFLLLFMSMKGTALSFFIICFFSVNCIAQIYSNDYELYTTRDGLPHNNILSAMQDSYGFLWIGTYSGLTIYDGNDFKNCPDAFNQQDDNWIYAVETIYEDRDKNIWIGSWGGLVSCFIRKEQKFRHYKSKPVQSKIRCFYHDYNGSVWVGYEDGLTGIIINDSVHTKKTIDGTLLSITGSKNTDSLFILSNKGLYIYHKGQGIARYAEEYNNSIYFIDVDRSKNPTIIVNNNGFAFFDTAGIHPCQEISVPQNNRSVAYSKVAMSKNGTFYFTDGYNIYKYDSLCRIRENYIISDNITFNQNNIINTFLEDNSGVLWIGTTSGLYKIAPQKHQFRKYSINNKLGYLTHNYVRAVLADSKNNIWVGFRSGMLNQLKYDTQSRQYRYYKSYSLKKSGTATTHNYSVNTLFEKHNGRILLGAEQGVLALDEQEKLKPYFPDSISNQIMLVWSMHEDKSGNLWIGTNGFGLFIYNKQQNKLYKYVRSAGEEHSICNDKIWKIFEDSRGALWLGTDKGLVQVMNRKDISDLKFRRIQLTVHDHPNVWNITEDMSGNLWIGTTGNGIFRVSKNTMSVSHIDEIKAKVISAIIVDKNENLWISTIGGVYNYNTSNGLLNSYSEDDGLLSNDFNYNAATITSEGKIFLGTKTGLVLFDPGKVAHNYINSSQITLTSLIINGNDSTGLLYNNECIVLPNYQNNFSIDFALLDFNVTKGFHYRYKLKNYHEDWIQLSGNQNRAVYNNVSPGDYYFIVEGSSDGTNWHTQKKPLHIIIKPAFWQIPLFWALGGSVIIILVIIIVRLRFIKAIRAEKEQTEIQKRIAELELKALQAQMNPHFIFNTMNSIQHFILNHNEVEANDYLTRFARLMRLVLESSKNKYIALNVELELSDLYLSLEQLRFEDKFDYHIVIDKDIQPGTIMIPSMLIQPFLENAIKHGLSKKETKGILKIIIDKNCTVPACIHIIIDDNGIGRINAAKFDKTDNHISRGIQLIEDRIKTYNFIESRKINIRFIDKSPPDEGTRVEIEIPVVQP